MWRTGPVAFGAIVLAFVWYAGRGANPGRIGFRLDDAWIHLVYARGLVEDQAFAYNPGTPATGCTSPLWAMGLAVLHAAFARGETLDALFGSVFAVGAALQLAAIAAAATLAREAAGSRTAGALAGVLVAAATPWAAGAFSGMEVTLTGLLLLAGVGAALKGAWSRSGWAMAGAALARPESAAVTLVMAAWIAATPAAPTRSARLARFLGPSIAAGGALVVLYAATSGSPLPATFHAKGAFDAGAFPSRLARAVTEIFPQIPPWGMGLGWLALLGYWPIRDRRRAAGAAAMPLVAGAAFLAANLALIDPVDPTAFYHVRYILPAVPLLLAALAIGAHRAGVGLPGLAARAPAALLARAALGELAHTAPDESRRFHNDVRNINEVQRTLGEWLRDHVEDGEWIASGDAGAIRYLSGRPTIDVLGLNTPQVRGPGAAAFAAAHPVRAGVVMPAWFTPENPRGLRVVREAETANYTVTSNPKMALQVVVEAEAGGTEGGGAAELDAGASSSRTAPRRVRFRGYRPFEVDLLPFEAAATPSRGAP